MSKSIFKKSAAILCGAATLAVISATAMFASAYETQPETKHDPAIAYTGDKTCIWLDNVIATKDDVSTSKEIPFAINISNNKGGFAATGVKFQYDPRLTVVMKNASDVKCDSAKSKTPATFNEDKDLSIKVNAVLNSEEHSISFGTTSADTSFEEGAYCICYFTLPSDAKPGDKFEIKFVDKDGWSWSDNGSHAVAHTEADGFIQVEPETTTSSTTTSTTTTTTTTSTSETSTTSTSQTSSTGTETGTNTNTGSGSSSTTTSTSKKSVTPGTTANGVKTGDAGVGIAIAGLMLAAGGAVAIAAKKKED